MIKKKYSVVGLGIPTRWHVSLQDDFATKEEAEAYQLFLEECIKMAERLDKELEKYNKLIQVPSELVSPRNIEIHSAWTGTLDCLQHVKFGDKGI